MDAYLGQIFLWPLDWAPVGTHFCDGTLLPIPGNEPLFAILGTTYGGDGQTNFRLPDLRGRVPLGAGRASSGSFVGLGTQGGVTEVTPKVKPHAHGLSHVTAVSSLQVDVSHTGQSTAPVAGAFLSVSPSGGTSAAAIYDTQAPSTTIEASGVATTLSGLTDTGVLSGPVPTGASVTPVSPSATPVKVINPYMGVQYIIFTQGFFPVRE